jgi:hypothetical protein
VDVGAEGDELFENTDGIEIEIVHGGHALYLLVIAGLSLFSRWADSYIWTPLRRDLRGGGGHVRAT